MEKSIIIVYYIFLPDNGRNWKSIVDGQINDLKICGLLDISELHVHISSLNNNLIEYCKEYIKSIIEVVFINSNSENQYEYPGIKLLYDLSQNTDKIMLYIHTKSMVFSVDDMDKRNKIEILLLRNTIKEYPKILKIFKLQL